MEINNKYWKKNGNSEFIDFKTFITIIEYASKII